MKTEALSAGIAHDPRLDIDLSAHSVGSFGDVRIDRLAAVVFRRMANLKLVCLRRLAGGEKTLYQAFWRLFKNRKFSVDELLNHSGAKTSVRASGCRHVLIIQDTCEVAFDDSDNPQREGLSPLNQSALGLLMHPALAVDADSKACLGVLAANVWTRAVENKPRKGRPPIEERESMRWISVAQAARHRLPKNTMVTVIGDRDSDIYEEYDRLPDETTHLVTRSSTNRMLMDGSKLFETLATLPLAESYELFLPAITGKRAARTALVELRFSEVRIKKTKNCTDKKAASNVRLYAVEAREVSPLPPDKEKTRLLWRLLTTHVVNDCETAHWIVELYKERWIIEQLFRVTKKQGLNLETSQLESRDGLLKIATLALLVAVQSLQLVQARDGTTKRPYTDVFDEDDLPLLTHFDQVVYRPTTTKQVNPHLVASLAWASWLIARIGGWTPYESRPPGPITIKNGLEQYYAVKKGWVMAKQSV
jgi:Transposase DDE domain